MRKGYGGRMTTIAWDGRTLAADTRNTNGNTAWCGEKLHRLADGRLFAGCSDAGAVIAAVEWLNDPSQGKPQIDKETGFCGLLVKRDGSVWYVDRYLAPQRVSQPFIAAGSGRDFAMAAMHLGKSAVDAIEVAAEFDIYTGGPIRFLTLEQ